MWTVNYICTVAYKKYYHIQINVLVLLLQLDKPANNYGDRYSNL